MTSLDQDIHRIQEIRQLLESRQRFFGGLQITELYKLNSKGEPLARFSTSQQHILTSLGEPTLGHSVEANFGSSTLSVSNSSNQMEHTKIIIRKDTANTSDDSSSIESDKETYCDDDAASSVGHYCADNSQNEFSSSVSSDELDKVVVTKRKKIDKLKRRSKGANTFRKPMEHTLEKAEQPSPRKVLGKPRKNSLNPAPPSSPGFRKKSVTFDKTLVDTVGTGGNREKERKSQWDPLLLLKKQSYVLRARAVKRLEDSAALSTLVQQGVLGVTNGTLAIAREKLKNAEKSLRVTVKTTENAPIKSCHYSFEVRKHPQTPQQQTAKLPKKTVSRLAIRQTEEALKSDLNLREAFALIKINPDPILDLASADSIIDKPLGNRGSSAYIPEEKGINAYIPTGTGMAPVYEDPETIRSLRRLTKLSVQHQKAQKSLIPESVNSQIAMQSMKSQGKKTLLKESADVKRASATSLSSRRKSSTTITGNISQRKFFMKKRSKDRNGTSGPKLAFSGLEAALRAERKGLADLDGNFRHGYYTVEKLSGTIL